MQTIANASGMHTELQDKINVANLKKLSSYVEEYITWVRHICLRLCHLSSSYDVTPETDATPPPIALSRLRTYPEREKRTNILECQEKSLERSSRLFLSLCKKLPFERCT